MTTDDAKIREGTVLAVEPGRLIVRVDREDDEECGGCVRCPMRGLCRGRDSGHLDIPVPIASDKTRRVGDRVRVAYREVNPAIASAVLFLPSLTGLFLGGFLAHYFWSGGDGAFLAGCGAGLLAGMAATIAAGRLLRTTEREVRLEDDA